MRSRLVCANVSGLVEEFLSLWMMGMGAMVWVWGVAASENAG